MTAIFSRCGTDKAIKLEEDLWEFEESSTKPTKGAPNYDMDTSSTCLDIYSRAHNTFGVTDFTLPISTSANSCRQALSRDLEPPSKRLKRDEVTKKFRCTHEGCAKSFGKSDHLKTHIRTHTGEKPFRCSSCAKGFSDLANLKRHIRVHTGEKPFTCTHPGCGKMFSVSSNLKQHRRTHTGERPYSCTICHKTFSHVSSRRKHLACHENGGDVVKSAPRSYKVEFEPSQLAYNNIPVQIKNEFGSPPPMYSVPATSSPNHSVSSNDQFSPYNPYHTVTPPSTSPNMQTAYMPDVKYDITYNAFSQPLIFSPYLVCNPNMVNYTSPTSIYTSPTSVYTSPQRQAEAYASPSQSSNYTSPPQTSNYTSPTQATSYASPTQATSYASPTQTTYASPTTQTSYSSPPPLESYSSPSMDSYTSPVRDMDSYTSPVHTADIDTSLDGISPSITFDSSVAANAIAASLALGELSACAQQKPAETFTDIPVPDIRDTKPYSPERKQQNMIVQRILCEPLYEYVFAALALLIAEHGTIIGQVPVDKMIGFSQEVRSAVQIIHRDNI